MIKTLLVVTVILLVFGFATLALYFLFPSRLAWPPQRDQSVNNLITDSEVSETQSEEGQEVKFSGTLTLLDNDLGLIVPTEDYALNNLGAKVVYYSAGTYQNTAYRGYTRYLAVREAVDPSGPKVFIFASKDQKTYVADSAGYDDYSRELESSKISKAAALPSAQPKILDLSEKFSLYRKGLKIISQPTGKKDQYGNNETESVLPRQTATYLPLALPSGTSSLGLKLFFEPWTPSPFLDKMASEQKALEQIKSDFFATTTEILAVDSVGLVMEYDLVNQPTVAAYEPALKIFNEQYQTYQQAVKRWKTGEKYPPYPEVPQRPSLALKKEQIVGPVGYINYSVAFPAACSQEVSTVVVKNIAEADLQSLGTSPNGELLRLVNPNHPLYHLEYAIKTADKIGFADMNKVAIPTFSEYVAKYPLLFFRDPWDRLVVLGEYDFKLAGGCGKPVLYFYPPKTTDITVNFTAPVDLTLAIPNYQGGWFVRATPEGTLTDLQPEYTVCSDIKSDRAGSEYAKQACQTNTYPYIYWEGNGKKGQYPEPSSGWIVAAADLPDFLDRRLSEVGLTTKERADMLSYWLPRMAAEAVPFYRVAFLQTREMNQIAPLTINPQPDSFYRLFLDYLPLVAKPILKLSPQKLEPIVRRGFTVVEWGGLKR